MVTQPQLGCVFRARKTRSRFAEFPLPFAPTTFPPIEITSPEMRSVSRRVGVATGSVRGVDAIPRRVGKRWPPRCWTCSVSSHCPQILSIFSANPKFAVLNPKPIQRTDALRFGLETRNSKLETAISSSETAAPPASVPKAPPAWGVSVLSHSPPGHRRASRLRSAQS